MINFVQFISILYDYRKLAGEISMKLMFRSLKRLIDFLHCEVSSLRFNWILDFIFMDCGVVGE